MTEKTLELFDVSNVGELAQALACAITDDKKLYEFRSLVGGDLSIDWMQMIYQYYLADRDNKKQDYTPASIATLMGMLIDGSEKVVDMCAGTGALIIQHWAQNPEAEFTALEIDENVIPFLLFNMVIRNIRCTVLQADVLSGDEASKVWEVEKGAEFGHIVVSESTL